LRVTLNTEVCDNPFVAFPEFKKVFTGLHLSNFLNVGDVMLVFGKVAVGVVEWSVALERLLS
jgi:hypothetical protein